MELHDLLETLPPPRFGRFYEALLPAMDALPRERLLEPNLGVFAVCRRAIALVPRLSELRAEAETLGPHVDLVLWDSLEARAGALIVAEVRVRNAAPDPDPRAELVATLRAARERLALDAEVLVVRGLAPPARGAERGCGRPSAFALADQVSCLVEHLQQHAEALAQCSTTSRTELEHIEALSERLLLAQSRHRRTSRARKLAASRRRQAFTLFAEAYEHVRRVVVFLRWEHGDADAYLPPLYAKARRRAARAQTSPKDRQEPNASRFTVSAVGEVHSPSLADT